MFHDQSQSVSTRLIASTGTPIINVLQNLNITFEYVERCGVWEDMGAEYWVVYKLSRQSDIVYVKFDGWYQSYAGSEYLQWKFVKPVDVVVTQYHDI